LTKLTQVGPEAAFGASTQRSSEAGFDLHLVKPVEPEQILAEVSKAAARR
jgi:CheY-like chemotaxis protein